MKKGDDFETFGRFCLGGNRQHAWFVFKKLAGSKVADASHVLHIDFTEEVNNVPVNLEILSCSLEQLTQNVSVITKETFKRLNLLDM